MKVAGVILAGGQSRRMGGREKSLLPLAGSPPIEWVARRLTPQVSALMVNANGDPARFDFLKLSVKADTIEGFVGPLAGILTGMKWAAQNGDFTHIATAAADTPFIPTGYVDALCAALDDKHAVSMAFSNGRIHPVAALWPVDLAEALKRFLMVENQRKILLFAKRYGLAEVPFALSGTAPGFDPFFNINTPGDMAIAAQIAEGLEK